MACRANDCHFNIFQIRKTKSSTKDLWVMKREEIERAIVVLDRRNGCTILKGNQRTKVKWGFHAVTAFGHNPNFPKTHLR